MHPVFSFLYFLHYHVLIKTLMSGAKDEITAIHVPFF